MAESPRGRGRFAAAELSGPLPGTEWTVLGRAERVRTASGAKFTAWRCRCSCGTEAVVTTNLLRSGGSRRCAACTGKVRGRWTPEADALLGTATDAEVAARLGFSAMKVGVRRNRAGIPPVKLAERPCVVCGGAFAPRSVTASTCSAECRVEFRRRAAAAWYAANAGRKKASVAARRKAGG